MDEDMIKNDRKPSNPLQRPNMVQVLSDGARKQLQRKFGTENCLEAEKKRAHSWRKVYANLTWRDDRKIHEALFQETLGGHEVAIQQLKNGEINGIGTGAAIWPAAWMLIKYMEHKYRRQGGMHGMSVVDLGTGTGIAGIATVALGAKKSILTDQQDVLFLTTQNVQTFVDTYPQHRSRLQTLEYNWGGDIQPIYNALKNKQIDVVLISDCILPKLYPMEPLVAAINLLCGNLTRVIMSYEHRCYQCFDPKAEFMRQISLHGINARVIPDDELHPDFWADDIEIWELFRVH